MPDEEVAVIFCYGCDNDSIFLQPGQLIAACSTCGLEWTEDQDDYASKVRDLAPFEEAILEGKLLPL